MSIIHSEHMDDNAKRKQEHGVEYF